MSVRSGVVTALKEQMSCAFDGEGDYVNNLYENIDNKVKHFDAVEDFPYISVTAGAEFRDDMPSNITFGELTVNITVYVKSEDEAQEQLESIISDVENFLDTHLQIEYNVRTSEGSQTYKTISNSIVSINTDEGILAPLALGQIVATYKYEKVRRI